MQQSLYRLGRSAYASPSSRALPADAPYHSPRRAWPAADSSDAHARTLVINIIGVHQRVLGEVSATPTQRPLPARASAEHSIPSHSHHLHGAQISLSTAGLTPPPRTRPRYSTTARREILIGTDADEATPVRATPPPSARVHARHRTGAAACASRALHTVASAPTAHAPRVTADRAIACIRKLRLCADHRPSGVDVRGRQGRVPFLQRLGPL